MSDTVGASKAAWERALRGMRTSHPTYKPALLLTILERIESDAAAGRTFDGTVPDDLRLALAFDAKLLAHGALLRERRVFMPLDFLSVRAGGQPDQLWRRGAGRLEILPVFQPVLADTVGRAWLRDLILDWLTRRSEARGQPETVRLAQLLRQDPRVADAALAALLGQSAGADGEVRESGLGLELAVGAGGAWQIVDGDPAFGARLLERLARGDFAMQFLRTEAQRRQGQRTFAHYVLGNFDGWCAFCEIRRPPLVEAAHLKPAREFPEIGLDPLNALALCSNHHRAFDAGILRLRGETIALQASQPADELRGLTLPLRPALRRPRYALRAESLRWRSATGS